MYCFPYQMALTSPFPLILNSPSSTNLSIQPLAQYHLPRTSTRLKSYTTHNQRISQCAPSHHPPSSTTRPPSPPTIHFPQPPPHPPAPPPPPPHHQRHIQAVSSTTAPTSSRLRSITNNVLASDRPILRSTPPAAVMTITLKEMGCGTKI